MVAPCLRASTARISFMVMNFASGDFSHNGIYLLGRRNDYRPRSPPLAHLIGDLFDLRQTLTVLQFLLPGLARSGSVAHLSTFALHTGVPFSTNPEFAEWHPYGVARHRTIISSAALPFKPSHHPDLRAPAPFRSFPSFLEGRESANNSVVRG